MVMEHRSIRGDLPLGNALCLSSVATRRSEPWVDDILVVEDKLDV